MFFQIHQNVTLLVIASRKGLYNHLQNKFLMCNINIIFDIEKLFFIFCVSLCIDPIQQVNE